MRSGRRGPPRAWSDDRLRRYLVRALRHRPDELGLSLDAGGFVPLRAVVEALRARGIADATEDRLRRVVAAQRDKRRLEIEGVRIRAAYGHSVAAVDASAYERRRPPPLLFHGTARGRVGAILREGLRPMGRRFVHLSPDLETAARVGRRHDPRPAILEVLAREAHEAGIAFHRPEPGVWLAARVPARFLRPAAGVRGEESGGSGIGPAACRGSGPRPPRAHRYRLLDVRDLPAIAAIGARNLLVRLTRPIRPAPAVPDWSDPGGTDITWLGHATFLIRLAGFGILTDPVLRSRLKVMRRLVACPSPEEAIARTRLLLISHLHFDHLDRPSLRRIPRDVPAIVAPGGGPILRRLGFRSVREIDWGEALRVGPVCVRALEVLHFGARTPLGRAHGYNAYAIESGIGAGGRTILFGGDTGYADRLAGQIRRPDIAILAIGGYRPASFRPIHASPEDAVRMAREIDARVLVPMHFETFLVSLEPTGEPRERLLRSAAEAGLADRLRVLEIGRSWRLA